jgi:DNA-directed RNA polymerase subunit RPC12/RpoP
MSEKKLSDLIMERLEKLEKNQPSPTTSTSEEAKGHKDIDEQLACPTCRAKIVAKLKPEIEAGLRPTLLKEVKEKIKNKELLTCDGCNELVEKEADECPTCHGKHAH